ncbi:MAG: xanthine dehydrogenase family protein subunit M [Chloroflexi bacterium]|nr:xanthine dehydrogenase family protein subunit M [Chloroflexota bacterium]
MRDFVFHTPSTLPEAFKLLDSYGEAARPMAGGTALVNFLKQGLLTTEHFVSLEHLPGFSEIRLEGDGIHIGALARHRDVETSSTVRQYAPLLADVYGRVATVRIRNMATVGGGLAHADPAQDPPLGLIVLNARVRLVSSRGDRTLPVAELFTDYYETVIQPGELLTEVIVPVQPPSARGVYLKFLPRTEDDYATVAVAALAEMDDGTCRRVRVALGAAGPTPIPATTAEEMLAGQAPRAELIRRAAESVAEQVDPLSDFRGPADYKRDMAVVFTRRALERILNGAPA